MNNGWIPNGDFGGINVGYDGSGAVFIRGNNRIYTVTAGSFTDTGTDSSGSYSNIYQYRQSTSILSNNANQVRTTGTAIKIKGTDTNGTLANIDTNSLWIYEMTGANNESQQAALKNVYVNSGVMSDSTL